MILIEEKTKPTNKAQRDPVPEDVRVVEHALPPALSLVWRAFCARFVALSNR